MKKVIYIYQLFQQGNIGAHQIEKIEDQPKTGFKTYLSAEKHLAKLFEDEDF